MEWYWFCVLTDADFILWDTDFILRGDTVTDFQETMWKTTFNSNFATIYSKI